MKLGLTLRVVLITPWAVTLALTVALAQPEIPGDAPQPPGGLESDDGPPQLEVTVESSYIAGGEAKFRGQKLGDSDAVDAGVSVSTLVPLNDAWSIPFEIQSRNIVLGSVPGAPVPDSIHTLEFGTGLAYRLDESWMFMGRINPVLYKLDDVGGNDLAVSGGLMALWEYSASVNWIFGLMVQPDNDLPVLPLVGVNWRINEQWELQLMLLAPHLIYTLDDSWSFFAGMDSNFGTTFRASDTLGTSIGLPRYDDALGSYSDLGFGGGVTYRLNGSWSFEAAAGYSINREIVYKDIDDKVKFDPAPYVNAGLKFEF